MFSSFGSLILFVIFEKACFLILTYGERSCSAGVLNTSIAIDRSIAATCQSIAA